MEFRYHINPADFSLAYLKENLLSRELIPSREPLKDGLEEKFIILKEMKIETIEDLLIILKTKMKLEEFSKLSGITIEYLTLLRREVNSYFPNPVPLKKFPGVSVKDLDRLSEQGIKNSRHLYEKASLKSSRVSLAKIAGISLENLDELVGLADLARAYGVGPVFARILYDTGIHSIRELIKYSPKEIIQLYEDKFKQKADFSLRDMKFCLEIARELHLGFEL